MQSGLQLVHWLPSSHVDIVDVLMTSLSDSAVVPYGCLTSYCIVLVVNSIPILWAGPGILCCCSVLFTWISECFSVFSGCPLHGVWGLLSRAAVAGHWLPIFLTCWFHRTLWHCHIAMACSVWGCLGTGSIFLSCVKSEGRWQNYGGRSSCNNIMLFMRSITWPAVTQNLDTPRYYTSLIWYISAVDALSRFRVSLSI